MKTKTAPPAARHLPLTPARQDAILSRCQWTSSGHVRVLSAPHTDALLMSAGIPHPVPGEIYLVPVRRSYIGFLVVKGFAKAQSESLGRMFDAAGVCYQARPARGSLPPAKAAAAVRGIIATVRCLE